MSLTPDDFKFLKGLFQSLEEKPLKPDDYRYVPLYQMDGVDPVERLVRTIQFSEVQSRQFFSGFRGSGKSTELWRMRAMLKERGYLVYYANALNYLNPAIPVDISELLVLLAGAFGDAVEEEEKLSLIGENYWTRFKNYITTTQVQLDEVELGLFKDVAKLKLAIRDTPSFRQKLQQTLSTRLYEVEIQVKKFFEDYVKALGQKHEGHAGIVFLFDNLEQLRGSASTEQEVIASVQRLFSIHQERLKIPYIHVVYTVPPWLKFLLAGTEVEILPSIVQWKNDAGRSAHLEGHACLRQVIECRFGKDGFTRFFGDGQYADEFVRYCGGNPRDLVRLLRESIRRADSLPITEQVVKASLRTIREQFLPIPTEDAIWLYKIAKDRKSALPDGSPETVARFSLFLDTHLVLFLRNGDEWYDIHPLIREHVEEIAKAESKAGSAP